MKKIRKGIWTLMQEFINLSYLEDKIFLSALKLLYKLKCTYANVIKKQIL